MTDVSTNTAKPWYFYLARCGDGSLYSGICVDLEARFAKHNSGKGAKYTRSRLPVTMVYSEELESHSAALKREAEVKRWSKDRKEQLAARAA